MSQLTYGRMPAASDGRGTLHSASNSSAASRPNNWLTTSSVEVAFVR